MKEINILPPIIYNRLSAGEVVENPASIVKELVENSLDASAEKITVKIVGGGIDEIMVTDNGEGVDETNLPKVFMPHATSKIKEITDIDHITSLGFRGEAMASIASVAKVEFTSKPVNQDYAVCINERNEIKRVASNQGTVVRVTDLFYNTPARRKFLRASSTEKNNVTQVIHDFIFAHPELNWVYWVDDKIVIDYQGQGLTKAVEQIFNVEKQNLLEVNAKNEVMSLQGLISDTHCVRPTRDRQVLIVNGRVVNGGLPASVINETMASYLPLKEYPIFVLHLMIDAKYVDVNVHPQKKEVRFENKDLIAQFTKDAITHTMEQYFLKQLNTLPKQPEPTVKPEVTVPPVENKVVGHSFNPEKKVSETILIQALDVLDKQQTMVESAPNIINQIYLNQSAEPSTQVSAFNKQSYQVLGQIFETYLLVQTTDSLLIIDQHAMAERMNYDLFRAQIDQGEVKSQMLLVPAIIHVTPNEMTKFEKVKSLLLGFGFECDQFGESAIRVTAIPAIMSSSTLKDFMAIFLNDKEIVDNTLSEALKHKVATMACKASIRAGDVLSKTQMEAFLDNYFATKNLPLCPHGRPIMLIYSKSKLESLFARK